MQITATASTQTFLFADIVNFTALAEREGDLRATEVAVTLAVCAAEAAAAAGADLVKAIGDAVMVRTAGAGEALSVAVRLRRDLARVPGFPAIHIGIHTGEAIEAGGDWYGHTVNVAARVTGAAGPGEILCTHATLAAAGKQEGLRFVTRGERTFKNATTHVGVYAVERMFPGLQRPVRRRILAPA